jgi:putative ABC transport system permease protein
MEKEGTNLLGQSDDSKMWIPASLLVTIMGDKISETSIQLKAKDNIPIKMFKDDIRVNMRAIRRLSPRAEDDFSMNESSVISGGLDTMFSAIGIAGSIIGGFSILVGGFGIANIMFVSVRERTGQIGIQKALGAKSSFILLQFLVESILLSLLGGVLGILFVSGLLSIASRFSEFELFLSFVNVITGIGLSAFIGLLSGLAPASMASKLDPVEAIRFNQ